MTSTSFPMPRQVEPSWHPIFTPLLADERMQLIAAAINQAGNRLCPLYPTDIFNAFSMHLGEVGVLILGQDPYPNQQHAMGVAFAVPEGTKKYPLSLTEIQSGLVDEIPLPSFPDDEAESSPFPTLQSWHEQGVLLLNSSLTCTVGRPNAHRHSWSWFMHAVLSELFKQKPNTIVWTMGKVAKELVNSTAGSDVTHRFHSNHPAATRYGAPFKTHFKAIAEKHDELHGYPIYWW